MIAEFNVIIRSSVTAYIHPFFEIERSKVDANDIINLPFYVSEPEFYLQLPSSSYVLTYLNDSNIRIQSPPEYAIIEFTAINEISQRGSDRFYPVEIPLKSR